MVDPLSAGERIRGIVARYLAVFPDERGRLAPLVARLEVPEQIHARHRMDGHVTGSAFVVDPARRSVLLIHHGTLDRWLQPGGHVDAGETVAAGAEREAREETGLAALTLAAWHDDAELPIDIDPHRIPANAKRGEAEHWHFDVRYLFVADASAPLAAQVAEVNGVRWAPLETLDESGMAIVASKIATWLDKSG
jgi:8-oxo-dGTP pyrophosphatase MutT (NUDIX family)